jgi:hypothetical protein
MQDYHVYAHYDEVQNIPKTNPISTRAQSINRSQGANRLNQRIEKENIKSFKTSEKLVYTTIGSASKINNYIGELTENKVLTSKTQTGLTLTTILFMGVKRPALSAIALGGYVGNKIINYEIQAYKENKSARFLRGLSGGVSTTRG